MVITVLFRTYVIDHNALSTVPRYDPKSESYGDYLFAPSVSCFITRFVPTHQDDIYHHD